MLPTSCWEDQFLIEYILLTYFSYFWGLDGVGVGWVDRRDVGCLRLGGSHRGPVVPATLVPPGKSRTIVTSIGVVGHTREQHHSSVFPSQPPTSGKSVAHFFSDFCSISRL